MHSPCPQGWKSEPADSPELVRLAVSSGLFPLYEVRDGRHYRINATPDWTGAAEYFDRQGRFPAHQVDLEALEGQCRERFRALEALAAR